MSRLPGMKSFLCWLLFALILGAACNILMASLAILSFILKEFR